MRALLNTVENLAVSTGAAVALAGHIAKGDPSAQETSDRISESGEFARDSDSLVIFTKHEEKGISNGKFFELSKASERAKKVQKSVIDGKWQKIEANSRNSEK